MKVNFKRAAAFAMLISGATQSFAATQLGDYFSFSGFGTLGLVQTDTNQGQFIRDDETSGATTHASFNVDSDLGLQGTVQPTKWLSATVQLLSKERTDKNISTEVEWAYAKVEPVEDLTFLVGRMDLPMFLVSDFRDVNYANTWVRPPNEVYGQALLHQLEGGEARYRLPIKSTTLSLMVLAGKSQLDLNALGELDVKNVRGWNAQWETDWVTLRAGRVWGQVSVGSTDRYTFTGFGATVDRNNILFQSEYVTRRTECCASVADANGWYALAGYRFRPFLPYVSYAKAEDSLPSAFHLTNPQSTVAAGVRWDAFKSADLKFQVERVNTYGTSGISFSTPALPSAGFGPPGSAAITKPVMVFSLAMDVVF
jgi:Gram-negative porin